MVHHLLTTTHGRIDLEIVARLKVSIRSRASCSLSEHSLSDIGQSSTGIPSFMHKKSSPFLFPDGTTLLSVTRL